MSKDVMVGFRFNSDVDFEAILDHLETIGWTCLRDGVVMYMVDDYDWKDLPPDRIGNARREIRRSYDAGEVVALSMKLPGEEIYGNLVFHADRSSVSFIPLLDYRVITGAPRWVDLSWYIERLATSLEDFTLTGITASDEL
ncbi:hypothetical protein [Sphaerisporangium sp. NPDC051011]|uniref:hypothetical protein n=1 Tax=Sphaerisporangium sp. NPDC051011 TaxID=3155792 RepID=UPI0033F891C7